MASKKSPFNPKIIAGVVIVLAILGFVAFNSQNKSQAPTSTSQVPQEAPVGTYALEFSGAGASPYIIVGSKTEDVREQLPITIEFLKNGTSAWTGTIDGDPSVVCRDATGCGMEGPDFNDLKMGKDDKLEVIAKGKDGTILARDNGSAQ